MSNEIYIEIDVTGSTGTKYTGTFTMKRYLTQKDRNEVARLNNKLCVGLQRSPGYNIPVVMDLAAAAVRNSLSKVLLDEKTVSKYEDSLNPEKIGYAVLDAILPEIKNQDPRAEEMYYLALLNVHITDAPEWWKKKGDETGGMSLIDYEPIAELYMKLIEAQKPESKENSTTE